MELELFDYSVEALHWGERTALDENCLSVCTADLQEQIRDLSHGIHIDFELARPGESKRIIHVLDTVLPIAKANDSGSTFPGFEGETQLVGTGQTTRIKNLLVTVGGRFPHLEAMTPIEKPREGMIDMTGVGAPYSYGSDYFHLNLSLAADESVSNAAFDHALRNIALRCARFLAQVKKISCDPERRLVALRLVSSVCPKSCLFTKCRASLLTRALFITAKKSRERYRLLFIRRNFSTAPWSAETTRANARFPRRSTAIIRSSASCWSGTERA